MIDASAPGSDGWWLTRLATQLGKSFPRLWNLKSHYVGEADVLDLSPDGKSADLTYKRFRQLAQFNAADLIVEAVTSRMVPVGFKLTTADSDDTDAEANGRWSAFHMGVQARDIFRDMAVYGQGFALVSPDGSFSTVDPWQAVVEVDPLHPWQAVAGLKVGRDDIAGADTMVVWWKDDQGVVWWRSASQISKSSLIPQNGRKWTPGKNWTWDGDAARVELSMVPLVPFTAKGGLGQFEKHLTALDRINHTIFQRLIITVMQAFRQRWISGDLPDCYPDGHPQAGKKIPYDEIFKAGPMQMWRMPTGTKVEESAITDITPLLTAVKDELKQLASVSQTPLYILDPESAQGSATGVSASREMLIFKVEDMCARAGDALVAAMTLSFEATSPARDDLSVIWKPVDRTSLVEMAQAASQSASTLPKRTTWRKIWQLTPEEMAQAEQDEADEAFEEQRANAVVVVSADGSESETAQ